MKEPHGGVLKKEEGRVKGGEKTQPLNGCIALRAGKRVRHPPARIIMLDQLRKKVNLPPPADDGTHHHHGN